MASHVFDTYVEALAFIKDFEDKTSSKFVISKRQKETNIIDVFQDENRRVLWEQPRGTVSIPFNGIPFLVTFKEWRDCHNGKVVRKKLTKVETDHEYQNKKRKLIQNTKKMNCPMSIIITKIVKFPEYAIDVNANKNRRICMAKKLKAQFTNQTEQKEEVFITIVGEHQNHATGELAGYGLPLDLSVKEKIGSLVLVDGLRDARVIKKIVDAESKASNPSCDPSSRRYFPTLKDIRNHMSLALKQTRFSDDDQSNVAQMVCDWQTKNPDDNIFFRPASKISEEKVQTLLFVHQSLFQKRLLIKYGRDIVLMDSTYNTSQYEIPLFFICVLTNCGYFVVATFLTGRETQQQISEALAMIRGWNPSWQTAGFMCDMDLREIGAINKTFPEATVHLCEFHREQSWDRWFNKNAKEEKETTVSCLRRIARSQTECDFDENLLILQDMSIYKTNQRFKNWIDKLWLQNKERWVHCHRTSSMAFRINTTNGVERQNRVLKQTFLKNNGSSKTLTSLISILLQEYLPECEQRYIRENITASSRVKAYSNEIPMFLHNRPHSFIKHCLKRIETTSLMKTTPAPEGLMVTGDSGHEYVVRLYEPSCSCPDWQKTSWPCKHLLHAIYNDGQYNWGALPKLYTENPCFKLDTINSEMPDIEGADTPTEDLSPNVSSYNVRSDVREQILQLIKELQNDIYIAPDNTLSDIQCLVERAITLAGQKDVGLPLRRDKRKKRKSFVKPSSEPSTCTGLPSFPITTDEIGQVIYSIWNQRMSLENVYVVGPYRLNTYSLNSILNQLTDEVMDSYLHITAQNAEQRVFHIPSIICTAIFTGQNDLHAYLNGVNIGSYDVCVGALNSSGAHWTLVVIHPKQKQFLYLDPLGERNRGKALLRKWNRFLKERESQELENGAPQEWILITSPHAIQTDSISCGVYVLKFAKLYLHNESMMFSAEDVNTEREHIARTLLGEGVIDTGNKETTDNETATANTATETDTAYTEAATGTANTATETDTAYTEAATGTANTATETDTAYTEAATANTATETGTAYTDAATTNTATETDTAYTEAATATANTATETDTAYTEAATATANNGADIYSPTDDSDIIKPTDDPDTVDADWAAVYRRKRVPKRKSDSFIYPPTKRKAKVYCVCKKKNDGREYWKCEACSEWYHPECLNIRRVQEPLHFFCYYCKPSLPIYHESEELPPTIDKDKLSEAEDENVGDKFGDVEDDEDDDEEIDNSFLYSSSILRKVDHIGIDRVKDIVMGLKDKKDPCMKRHELFKRERKKDGKGLGYSLFSTMAIMHLELLLMKTFFTDETRNYYVRHPRIKHLKDDTLKDLIEENQYMAKLYVKEVCLPEAMIAIVSENMNVPYFEAENLVKEVEDSSDLMALRNGIELSGKNKSMWEKKLKAYQ